MRSTSRTRLRTMWGISKRKSRLWHCYLFFCSFCLSERLPARPLFLAPVNYFPRHWTHSWFEPSDWTVGRCQRRLQRILFEFPFFSFIERSSREVLVQTVYWVQQCWWRNEHWDFGICWYLAQRERGGWMDDASVSGCRLLCVLTVTRRSGTLEREAVGIVMSKMTKYLQSEATTLSNLYTLYPQIYIQ